MQENLASTRWKRVAVVLLLWVIPSSIIFAVMLRTFQIQRAEMETRDELQAESLLNSTSAGLCSELMHLEQNLLFLSRSAQILKYLDTGNRRPAEQELLQFVSSLKVFDQVRIIDSSGQEIIRINLAENGPYIVPGAELQNKSGRYYFNDSINLARDKVFVSPLDLNIEQGVLELPIKPMIRLATPIFDSQGMKRGFLIFNFLAARVLEYLNDEIVLLNSDGFWLHGGKLEDRWGFMFEHQRSFKTLHPELWDEISKGEEGHSHTGEHFVSFATVRPISLNMSEDYFWKLLIFAPDSERYLNVTTLRKNFLYVFIGIGVLFLILSYFFVRILFDTRNKVILELEAHERELAAALTEVNQLSGLLPICSSCKNVRDDQGYWNQIEAYISDHSEAEFSHGLCPECLEALYPEF